MRRQLSILGMLILTGLLAIPTTPAKEKSDHQPVAWCYVRQGPLETARPVMKRRAGPLSLGQGTLAAVLKTESRKGRNRALVRVTDLTTLDPVEGWVDASQVEIIPVAAYPSDQGLLRQLGGEYRDELAQSRVAIARWLVKQGGGVPALVCFVASAVLPASRLVAFLPDHGSFIPGPSLEFPFSDMNAGILSGEVRDLLGDQRECFITREPFRDGPVIGGVNMVIRQLEDGDLRTLWAAPIEFRNLGFFPSNLEILHPLERNVGAPGTATKAEVEFQKDGRTYIPVWKGQVDFLTVGQDKPIEQIKVTKACRWNGRQFDPLR